MDNREWKPQLNATAEDQYEGWTILELMGHRRIIGYVRQQEIAGRAFLRVDIPADPPVTQFYGPESVYCMTPTTEDTARSACSLNRVSPVQRWELPAPAAAKTEPVDAEIVDPDQDDQDDPDRDGDGPWGDPLPLEDAAATGTAF